MPVGTVALTAITVGAAVDKDVGICMSFVRCPVGGGLPAQVAGGEDVEGDGVGEEVGGEIDEDEGEGHEDDGPTRATFLEQQLLGEG